ncbi:MAG: Cof-type HAD-IIB family hydrolase [Ruminococcaceae bacterium]|nr:Cof-type HAD-IIB family hydrolase [Oscillospiraceae bacterium]
MTVGKRAFRLLAVDMDGTVLNTEKIITPRTGRAMETALSCGKEVVFATGRCPAEMRNYLAAFPTMRYAMCLSGALLLDLRTGVILDETTLSPALAAQILSAAEGLDVMAVVYAGNEVYLERRRRGDLAHFWCDCYTALYDDCGNWVERSADVLSLGESIRKINFFCHSEADYRVLEQRMAPLPVNLAQGSYNNCEVSPLGVDKGAGLERLCRAAGIPVTESIAVGDSGNDLAMLRAAGLSVAMENATAEIKAAADVTVSDCDHDGVAEVIETYLL